jgi:MFS family permease
LAAKTPESGECRLKGITAKALLNFSIVLGVASTAVFLLLWNEALAAVINFFSGFASGIAFIATFSLAADYCPQRSEGFAFAMLTSLTNFTSALSDNMGSFLYEHLFHHQLNPLVVASTAFTAVAFAFVPFLRLGDKPPGEAARVLATGEN